ncbi:MAG: hypothetical protein QW292_03605 [Candidatus Parvarchaeota archaeon]
MTETEGKPQNLRYVTILGPGYLENLDKTLIGRILTFELLKVEQLQAKLTALGMYDLVVMNSRTGQRIIIMKSCIVSIRRDISLKPK